MRNAYTVLAGNMENTSWETKGVNEMIILK
jgi:hypothetical protein